MTEKCAVCGRFVPYSEMEPEGGAKFYFEPDSHFGPEVSEWTCHNCNREHPRNGLGTTAAIPGTDPHLRWPRP